MNAKRNSYKNKSNKKKVKTRNRLLEKNTIKEKDNSKEICLKRKKKKLILKKKYAIVLFILFATLSIYSVSNIIRWIFDNKNTAKELEKINENVEVDEVEDSVNTQIINPPEEKLDNPYWDYIKMNLINVDFAQLKAQNNDTAGWIQVNGTNINYPFVQTTDNSYYLKKDFNKKYNSAGWVFMDYRNNLQNFDKNTIIYAHGRINGTMFGSLKNIIESNWYSNKNNHIVKISTEYENTMWQVFSIYRIPETSDYLKTTFNDNEKYIDFLNMIQNRSEFKFDVSLNEKDKILTLSTCYKESDRVVLHAKLIKMEVRNGNN